MSGEKLKAKLDMDDLTFADMEDFENATGVSMSDAVKTEIVRDPITKKPVPDPKDEKGRPLRAVKMSARAMNGMLWLALRKDNPALTFEEVRRMKMSEVDFEVEDSGEIDEDAVPLEQSEPDEATEQS